MKIPKKEETKQKQAKYPRIHGKALYQAFLWGGLWFASLLIAGTTALAVPQISQYIVSPNPVVDEYGVKLAGTSPDALQYGNTPVEGDIVQILLATDHIIHPPDVNGNPHPNNIVLDTIRIGWGVSPSLGHSGMFGAAIPRPDHGSYIFVRVFNAPTLEDASFYDDSDLFKTSNAKFQVFYPQLSATDTPIDPNDDDGDGVNNSWEKSRGMDYDGDGMNNAEEMASGTDPYDQTSFLSFTLMKPIEGTLLMLQWDSIPGRTYIVESVGMEDGQPPTALRAVEAKGTKGICLLPLALLDDLGCLRLRVLNL